MSLTLRRGSGGMLEYKPFSQRYQEDKIRKEERKLEYIVWDSKCDDNTMRVYAISAPNNCEKRIWSTGSKDDTQQKLNLQDWYNDIVTRIVEPTMVMFFPYNLETGENLGRSLNENELKDKTRKIIPPRQVCGVPILQGWDLAILQKMNNSCQIGLTGPGASETERYILKKAINLNKENYYLAKNPYVKFEKVLIIALEKDISGKNFELKSMLKTLTSKTKVLYFLPTYLEAKKAERKISKNIATMYYDGEQKISNNPIEGTSIHFDLCISCIHGPLGQGINLGQFKMAIVDTSNERPKCLFAGRPDVKSIHEYVLDDVTEKARQAALRILRLAPNDSPDIPRVVLFYGRNAKEVSCRVEKELTQVGHQIKIVEAKECIPYAQDVSLKWLTNGDISDLEKFGVQCYEEKEIIEKAKTEIVNYLQKNPNNNTWRDITRKFRTISELTDTYEKMIKQWFNEYANANKLDRKLEKILEKIRIYIQENPQAEWRKIYNAFNLSRKTKEETMMIKERLNM